MDVDPGWQMLRSGELLHVDDSLRVSERLILDQPPARPLSIEDLNPTAQASQAHSGP
jgi:hypothetical protein